MSEQSPLEGVEHQPIPIESETLTIDRPLILFRGQEDRVCLELTGEGTARKLLTSYYVGVDWLQESQLSVRVQPKLNCTAHEVDHLAMLFGSLKHADVAPFALELYQIDFEAPPISVQRQDDLLTPLLVAHFLYLLQTVVRQGLKKGYNPVARDLHSKVKGKIDVARTLRQGIFRQRPLVTSCRYDEYSFNITENRLLKRALRFARRFVSVYPAFEQALAPILSYCEPAFQAVSDVEDEPTPPSGAPNPLYQAYDETLGIAQLLLRRFGYSMTQVRTESNGKVAVPPHWIDTSRLFELYVLGLLKDRFGKDVHYEHEQGRASYGLPDYLLKTSTPWIMDAKYKARYQQDGGYHIEDIRQSSGYSRDVGVLRALGIDDAKLNDTVVPCLIVYPDMLDDNDVFVDEAPVEKIPATDQLDQYAIEKFICFYKLAIKLPRRQQ